MTPQSRRTRRHFHPQSLTNLMSRRRGRGIVALSLFCLVLLGAAAFIGTSHAGRYKQDFARQDGIEPQGGTLPDVFVANRNSNRVVRINPNTGTQTLLTSGGSFNGPTGVDIGPDGFLYVTSFSNNNIVRVDPATGTQTVIATGNPISNPVGIIYASDGNIYVANSGNNSIVRINAATGSLTTFASGGALGGIQFLAFAPDGFLYVASATNNSIVRINAITGAQNTLTSGNLLGGVTGLTFGADGNIYTTNTTNNSIVRVNPNDGAQTLVSPVGGGTNLLNNPRGLTFGADGNLLVGNNSGAGNVLRIDPNTGAQTIVSAGGQLNNVWGITRVEQTGNRGCTPPPTGLVAWYAGDGNANDIQGNNNGTLQNGATFAAGKVGQAFSLDGTDDYVQVASPTGLPVSNSARTLDLWFRTPANFSDSTELALVQYGTPTDNNMFGLVTSRNAPGKLYFFGFNNDLAGTTTLQPNTFYHAAVTYDGSTLNLYLNGQIEATKNTTALNTIIDQNGLTIGFRPDFPLFGAGLIDEVEIFNRALSQTEIQPIFNADGAGKCKVPLPSNAVTDVTWINASGGTWNNPANWRDGTGANRVPTATDHAFIDLVGTYTVTLDIDPTVANFTLGATSGTQTFTTNSRTLTLNGASTVRPTGIFNLNGGTLTGSGELTAGGVFNWSGGTMSGTGATNIASGATLNIPTNDNFNLNLARTLNNSGTAVLTAATTNTRFLFGSSTVGTFNNLAGAIFDLQADVGIAVSGGGVFNNAGTFRKSAAAGTSIISVPFNNSGVVELQSGTLNFSGGGTSSGAFNAAVGTFLGFTSGTHTLAASSSIDAPAAEVALTGTVNIGGSYNAETTLPITGTVTFTGNIVNIGSQLTIRGSTTFNSNNLSFSTLNLEGGTLGGSANVNVTGTLNWSGGTMSGTGATNIAAGATLNLLTSDRDNLILQRTLNNSGTAVLTAATTNTRFLFGSSTVGTFNNLAGAIFDLQADVGIAVSGGGVFNNAGTFRKSAAAGTSTISVPFNNSGVVEVQSATTLNFQAGGTSSGAFNAAAGTFLGFDGTHTLQATSSINAPSASVRLGGSINIAGSYNVGTTLPITGTVTFTGNIVSIGTSLTIRSTVTFNSNNLSFTTLNLEGGTLGGSANISIPSGGTLNWSGGTMSGTGATNIAAGATLNLLTSDRDNLILQRTLNNSGTAVLTAATTNTRFLFGSSTVGTFNNLAGAIFDLQADVGIAVSGGGVFNNAGTFRKSAAAGTSTISVPFNNSGVVEVLMGRLNFAGGFNQTSGTPPVLSGTILTRPPGSLDPMVRAERINDQLVITPRANVPGESFNAFATVSAIDLTKANVSAEIVQAAAGGAETAFAVANNADNFLRFLITTPDASPSASSDTIGSLGTPAPQLIFQINSSARGMRELKRIAYDPVRHRFLRFRAETTPTAESPRGFIAFDTSGCPAQGTCSPSRPELLPWVEEVKANIEERSVEVNALSAELSAGTSRAVAQPGQAIFDNFQLVRKNIKGRGGLRGRGRTRSTSSNLEDRDQRKIYGGTSRAPLGSTRLRAHN